MIHQFVRFYGGSIPCLIVYYGALEVLLVREVGIEPTWAKSPRDFESNASNRAIPYHFQLLINQGLTAIMLE